MSPYLRTNRSGSANLSSSITVSRAGTVPPELIGSIGIATSTVMMPNPELEQARLTIREKDELITELRRVVQQQHKKLTEKEKEVKEDEVFEQRQLRIIDVLSKSGNNGNSRLIGDVE